MSTARHRISFTDLVNGENDSWTCSICKFRALIFFIWLAPVSYMYFLLYLRIYQICSRMRGFTSNFILVTFIVICWETPYIFKIFTKKIGHFTRRSQYIWYWRRYTQICNVLQRIKWCLVMELLSIFHIVYRVLYISTIKTDLIVAFPWQQYCHRAIILRYEYIACIVV